MFFTIEDYKKIQEWLSRNSIKDTEFNDGVLPLNGEETIALVQNKQNIKVFLKDFIAQLALLGSPDFINISDKFGENYISLSQAIKLIPYRSRKIGQVITFLDEFSEWRVYQFQGERVNQWNNTTLWIDLLQAISDSSNIVPDEEDITGVLQGGRNLLKFRDKNYNRDNYSGLGRIFLRKNLTTVTNPSTMCEISTNLLTQEMISREYTIYIIQYDYTLNGNTVVIPKGSILDFQGGSIDDGTLSFEDDTKIKEHFIGNATIEGNPYYIDYTPDEEDITIVKDVIKFKDKEYNPSEFSGLSRIYLRKNISKGKNILTQDMVNNSNTRYIIQYDYDLDEKEIIIPSGCILDFQGGILRNGAIIGNNTSLRGDSYNIFHNVILYNYGFIIDGELVHCNYIDYSNEVINVPENIISSSECIGKLKLSKKERASYSDGIGTIIPFDNTLSVNDELIIENPIKLEFSGATATAVINTILSGNQRAVFYLNSASDSNFEIPNKGHWLFLDANNNILPPKTLVNKNSVYVSYLSRAIINTNNRFTGRGRLEWFVNIDAEEDSSKGVNIAFNTPGLDIVSDIQGDLILHKPVYLEVPKNIILQNNVYITSPEVVRSNNPIMRTIRFNFINNLPLLYIRTGSVSLIGGEFSAESATVHTSDLCIIDCDYLMDNVLLKPILVGKKLSDGSYSSNRGYSVKLSDRSYGYITFSTLGGIIKFTKFPVYTESRTHTDAWCTGLTINPYIWGFYQAITMYSGGVSTIDCSPQSQFCVPIDEVDNYYWSYFASSVQNIVINMYFWDVSRNKTDALVQKPYRKALIDSYFVTLGPNAASFSDQFTTKTKNLTFQYGTNPKMTFNTRLNNGLRHYALNDVFCDISNAIYNNSRSYFRTFDNDGNVDLSTNNSRISDTPGITTRGIVHILDTMFSAEYSGYGNSVMLNSNSFIELYMEAIDGYYLNKHRFSSFTVNFSTTLEKLPFKKMKIVGNYDSDNPLVYDYTFNDADNDSKEINISTNVIFSNLTNIIFRFYEPLITDKYIECGPIITCWSQVGVGSRIENGFNLYGNINVSDGGSVKKGKGTSLYKISNVYIGSNSNLEDLLSDLKKLGEDCIVLSQTGTAFRYNAYDNTIRALDGSGAIYTNNCIYSQLPTKSDNIPFPTGTHTYIRDYARPGFYNESTQVWIDSKGYDANINYFGSTTYRNNINFNSDNERNLGFMFYDTTLQKPVWWTGKKWVDATGAEA